MTAISYIIDLSHQFRHPSESWGPACRTGIASMQSAMRSMKHDRASAKFSLGRSRISANLAPWLAIPCGS
jgi:hypothetical protein